MAEAPEAPQTPYAGGGGWGYWVEPYAPEDHLYTKFHPDLSSGLDFYREETDRHTHCPLCFRSPCTEIHDCNVLWQRPITFGKYF